jgi:hypothetical protein
MTADDRCSIRGAELVDQSGERFPLASSASSTESGEGRSPSVWTRPLPYISSARTGARF